jgi:alanyl-tRNA synthetase
MLSAAKLRQKYFDFFQSKGHRLIPSASLIPENDPTVLFTTAGMHPLVPYLLGESHPEGRRLVNAQKCVRTNDIDEVGDATHHTFFEMLGNWSLGDYFKKEAIEWSWEFLTSPLWLGLAKERLAVSVFAGVDEVPFDEEAYRIWQSLGVPEKRIARLTKKDNWWGQVVGPCGPDTEIFYWAGESKAPENFDPKDNHWVEIWNDVFMQYNQKKDGTFELLTQKNVDTGMGLERILAVVNGLADNYLTDLWTGIIKKIEELSGKKYGEDKEITRAMRIIADHIKAATFIIGDEKGIAPSNNGAGYIVRRLIRRAIRYMFEIPFKSEEGYLADKIAEVVIETYKDAYPELERNKKFILNNFIEEESKFRLTLIAGENKIKGDLVDGEFAFNLFQTYGYPPEMTREIAAEKKIKLSLNFEKEYQAAIAKHQELSRTASAGMFKGGLADASEATKKLHTAAHLLLASLRKVLGNHVFQKGSNITPERLRFDFSHPEKMTPVQITAVEKLVNEAIAKDLPVVCEEKSLAEAKAGGAMGVFESKYGEKVKVYKIGEGDAVVSQEICGGPHASNTGVLGHFKITKEESSSSGVRRIKAILENNIKQ